MDKKISRIVAVSHFGGDKKTTILKQAAESLDVDFQYIRPGDQFLPTDNTILLYRGGDIESLEMANSAIYYFESLEGRKFNRIDSLRLCADKASQYKVASKNGIKIPSTFVLKAADLMDWSGLDYPIIVKKICSFGGKGVYKIDNIEKKKAILKEFSKDEDVLVQEFIDGSDKKDLRVYIIGNKVVGGLIRAPFAGDFRGNTSSGANFFSFWPEVALQELSLGIAKAFKITAAAIDFLQVNDDCYFIEINDTFGFNGDIELGKKYINHILANS